MRSDSILSDLKQVMRATKGKGNRLASLACIPCSMCMSVCNNRMIAHLISRDTRMTVI